MTTQEELFPKTPVEVAEVFLEHFQADVDSAEKSLVNAKGRLKEARILRDMAEGNLLKVREAAGADPLQEMVDEANRGEYDTEGVKVTGSMGTLSRETGEILDAMVVALYPTDEDGAGNPTPVGEHTLYGELVADYLTAAGLEDPIDDYQVLIAGVGEDPAEVQERDLGAVIAPADYGKRLLVVITERAAAERFQIAAVDGIEEPEPAAAEPK